MPTIPQATHPTRSAKLCINCRHRQGPGDFVMRCNHPAYPISATSGNAQFSCADMRSDTEAPVYLSRGNLPLCSSAGLLFEPVQPAPEASAPTEPAL